MKRYGQPEIIVMDKLRSNGASSKDIAKLKLPKTGHWLKNSGENSRLNFRRRSLIFIQSSV